MFIQSVSIKQQVLYIVSERRRGPRTEKIHFLKYSEYIPGDITEVERLIQFPIPKANVLDPDIDTAILKVTHLIDIKLKSEANNSPILKIQIPLKIGGFPYYLFEDADVISVATLPIYEPEFKEDDENSSIHFLRMTRTMETLRSEYENGNLLENEAIFSFADAMSDYALKSAIEELTQGDQDVDGAQAKILEARNTEG